MCKALVLCIAKDSAAQVGRMERNVKAHTEKQVLMMMVNKIIEDIQRHIAYLM